MRTLATKPNIVPADAVYPYGAIRDKDGATAGTSVDELTYGDTIQLVERMFAISGITPTGLADNVTNGFQLYEAFERHLYHLGTAMALSGTATFALPDIGTVFEVTGTGTIAGMTTATNGRRVFLRKTDAGQMTIETPSTTDPGASVVVTRHTGTELLINQYDIVELMHIDGKWVVQGGAEYNDWIGFESGDFINDGSNVWISESSGDYYDVSYKKVGNIVHLAGIAHNNSVSSPVETQILTLPVVLRPLKKVRVLAYETLNNAPMYLEIDTNGLIKGAIPITGGNDVYLDGISYRKH